MKHINIILASLSLVILTLSDSWAVTLDREGKGQRNPDYFTCTNIKLDGSAGGTPNFKISLKGLCAVHPGDGLAGWTPLSWSTISVKGTYNYDTNVAKETIWDGPDIIFEVALNCKKNPWAHGAYVSGKTCSVNGNIINNVASHYVVIQAPYPLSSKYMDNSLRSSLKKWEVTPTTEELLADWDPYGGPKGTDHIKIVKPANYTNIDANLPYYMFELAVNQPHPQLGGGSNVEIEQLEIVPEFIGDIAMPSAGSQWWQTMWTGNLPLQEWPMGISQGLFSGKAGQFRIRAKGKKKSSYVSLGGWSPWKYFCIGVSNGCQISPKQIKGITQSTKAGKVAIASDMFKVGNNKPKKSLVLDSKSGKKDSKLFRVSANRETKAEKLNRVLVNKISKPNQVDTRLTRNPTNNRAKAEKHKQILVNKISNPSQPDTRLSRDPGNEQAKTNQLRAVIAGSKNLTAVRPLPNVLVDRVAYKPAPLSVGKTLDMDILFKNAGAVISNINQGYRINCVVLSGGACPVANKTATIGRAITPDGSTSIILKGVKKAEVGRFTISVVVTGQVGRPYSFTIDVKPIRAIKKVTPRKIQPHEQNVDQAPSILNSIKSNGSNLRMLPVN